MGGGAGEGARRVGRPRADQRRPESGRSPREELLCAAAELFTVQGYAATTTRSVAERAGMRQATMYHYFGGKEELLAELLESTVAPSLALAHELLADTERPAGRRLWELCRSDVLLLCGGPYNLGALYLLPEVGGARFARFHRMRRQLRDVYLELLDGTSVGATLAGDRAGLTLRNDLVFGLIEGVMLIHRSDPARPVEAFAEAAADAALRIAGVEAS
ncbi:MULTISPECIES: TetR/AcrR family transcriptional regulator [unclassified Streptomyces]|uniref:TetR/AcrR family transcriptional regulator n=1 Tax=unclassified Streptomyces TaxID=2593676 RepID=UPI001BEC20C8|nr:MULTISPECIES: TetR/AcrR family transcriptional regulator [unclassified Streptomyces]MBT2403728.1 TetR/AcrR family transcriptional regulator [Streptomyces sp. ISL-21]MBT2459740.1 TetR/AcrR family transcriptional regulator [Streptomyces sp. ISL-86]MBT2611215.1 TetR/AcrR family transcriptional regulator [Streptomyces sp. ISL-87]